MSRPLMNMDTLQGKVLPTIIILFAIATLLWITGRPSGAVPVKRHTILLIDQTDKLTERCLDHVADRVLHLPSREAGERLSVFYIHERSDVVITPLLSVLSQGAGGSRWTENIEIKLENFKKEVLEPLQAIADGLVNCPRSASSPIVETINKISTWSRFSADIPERNLIVYSDMLQHSNNCTDYDDDEIVFPGSPGCPEMKPMTGVNIDIRYIMRKDQWEKQTLEHQQQWVQRLEQAGARVTLERIN